MAHLAHRLTIPLFAAAALLSACGGKDEGAPKAPTGVPRFTQFGLEANVLQVRPHTCVTARLMMKADRIIPKEEMVWTAASPDVDVEILQFDVQAELQSSVAKICARGKLGKVKFTAGLKSWDGLSADGTVEVALPGEGQHYRRNPIAELHGGHHDRPSRVFWTPDGKSFFVASHDNTVTRWNGTTMALEGAWLTLGRDAALVDENTLAVRVHDWHLGLFDMMTNRYATWMRELGEMPVPHFPMGVDEKYQDNAKLWSTSAAAGRLAVWERNFDQNAGTCKIGFLDLATNKRTWVEYMAGAGPGGRAGALGPTKGSPATPMGSFEPEYYTELSSKGRYLAYGPGGCWNGAVTYDTMTDSFAECGNSTLTTFVARPTFSADESTFAVGNDGSEPRIDIYSMPGCTPRGFGTFRGWRHLGWALSPDGRTLAVGLDGNGANADVLLFDVSPESPNWKEKDPSYGSHFGATKWLRAAIKTNIPYQPATVWASSAHRLAFSPDGQRLAVVAPNGRAAVLDLSKPDGAPVLDTQPQTADALRVIPQKEGRYVWVESPSREVYDLKEKRVIGRYPHAVLISLDADSFVIRRDLSHFRIRYDDPGKEEPIDGTGMAPMPPPSTASPTGKVTCEPKGPIIEGQLCVSDSGKGTTACHNVKELTGGKAVFAEAALMLNESTCVFTVNGGLFSWNIGGTTAFFETYVAGSPAGALYRMADGRVMIVTKRLNFWRHP